MLQAFQDVIFSDVCVRWLFCEVISLSILRDRYGKDIGECLCEICGDDEILMTILFQKSLKEVNCFMKES